MMLGPHALRIRLTLHRRSATPDRPDIVQLRWDTRLDPADVQGPKAVVGQPSVPPRPRTCVRLRNNGRRSASLCGYSIIRRTRPSPFGMPGAT